MFGILGTPQKVAIAGTSAQSSAIGLNECILQSTVDCFYLVGSNPTAVADGASAHFLTAGVALPIPCGQGDKIAVISASAATGTLYITPMG